MTRFLGITLVSLATLSASAQYFGAVNQTPTVSTSGSAEIRVVPDRIEIAVGVETLNPSLAQAKAANDAAIARVVATAKKHQIDAGKIQTDYLNIEPNYDSNHQTNPVSYTVRRSVVIMSEDIGGFESLLSALIEAGANHVHGIRFMTSKLREHRDKARTMATQAALEKARLLAQSLGRKVGKARSVTENGDWGSSYGSWWGRYGSMSQNVSQNASSASGETPDGPLSAGRISVTASVSVTFDLE